MARRSLITQTHLVECFLSNIAAGAAISVAADASGLGASTVYAWLARAETVRFCDPKEITPHDQAFVEFRDAVMTVRAAREIRILKVVTDEVDNGNWRAAAWYLERTWPERWSSKRAESEDNARLRVAELFPDDHSEPTVVSRTSETAPRFDLQPNSESRLS